MAENHPTRKEIELVFKKLRSFPANKVCFDCTAKNPTWASITYGVFICIDCSAIHRSLGVHLTFVRSTQLDINWTWQQLHQMQLGGNANAETFFQQHNCTTKDAQQKYNSRAAHLYREKLLNATVHAMALHGQSKLCIDDHDDSVRYKVRDVDFFEEHDDLDADTEVLNQTSDAGSCKPSAVESIKDHEGPSVNLTPITQSEEARKPIIGGRKSAAKRSGPGGKKLGSLGAQRVKTNFADVEKEAELADKLRIHEKNLEKDSEDNREDEDAQIASMRLAYEDLSLKQRKEEEKIKSVDPAKAQQLERLGMGLGTRSGISHSAVKDMRTIEQESPAKSSNKMHIERDSDEFFDDFGFSSSNSSGFLCKSASDSRSLSALLGDSLDNHRNMRQSLGWGESTPSKQQATVEKKPSSCLNLSSNEAQKKFGSAKAISSDQFFSDSTDPLYERKSNLSRFEGSSSISSAEYFGRKEVVYNRGVLTPDLEDVKESVKQGVTKVAGKLSSLANGVMSSIQDKYGF